MELSEVQYSAPTERLRQRWRDRIAIRRSSLAKIECGQFIVSCPPREADGGQIWLVICTYLKQRMAKPATPLPLIPAMPPLVREVENG